MGIEMPGDRTPSDALAIGHEFIRLVLACDEPGIAALFASGSVFRAVVPSERPFREQHGGEAAARQLCAWFEDADLVELLESEVQPVADMLKVRYHARVREPDGWKEVEQQAYVELSADGFVRMNLVCSGFRPVPAPGAT